MPKLVNVKLKFNVPGIGGIEGSWEPELDEQMAAWELYVELVTRISVAKLDPGEGLLRETLASLYSIFESSRAILRKYGPSIARPKGKEALSFGVLAIAILNFVLRPVLVKWHPLLLDHESRKETGVSSLEHESKWDKNAELREVLEEVRGNLIQYANILADIAEIPPMIVAGSASDHH